MPAPLPQQATRWLRRWWRACRYPAAFSRDAVEAALLRANTISFVIALSASAFVYVFHDWYHAALLPALHMSSALGDALGGLLIVAIANAGVRLASLLFYRDRAYGLMQSAAESEQVHAQLQNELADADRLAGTDKLTGCLNRHRFESVVVAELDRVARHGHKLSFVLIDIDHFKAVNDTHGHNAGDAVLVAVAQALRTELRVSDALIRWGGEEFLVLCPETSLRTALRLAERLRATVAARSIAPVGTLTVSIGVAQCLPAEAWSHCLERADGALYRAKQGGRNQVQHAPEQPPGASGQHVLQLQWHEDYLVGHDVLDKQHEALFTLANALLNAVASDAAKSEMIRLIDQLVLEVGKHFATEEALLHACVFPRMAEHEASHELLLTKATRFAADYRAGRSQPGALLQLLVRDLIEGHILQGDRDYIPALAATR